LGHLEAGSTDGIRFQGHYGYPAIDHIYCCDFTLYKADEEVLLYGKWYETNSGCEGKWLIQLSRKTAVLP